MIGKTIMKGLVLIVCFIVWDAWLKELFYGYVGDAGIGEVFLGYAIVFGAALILGELTVRALGLNESDESASTY